MLDGGARAIYHVSGVTRFGPGSQIHLYGSEGTLKYELAPHDRLWAARRGEAQLSEIPVPPEEEYGWHVEEEFIAAIREPAAGGVHRLRHRRALHGVHRSRRPQRRQRASSGTLRCRRSIVSHRLRRLRLSRQLRIAVHPSALKGPPMLRILSLTAAILASSFLAATPDPVAPDPNSPRPIEAVDSVFIEDLTWMEVRDAMKAGKDTVIVADRRRRAERALPGHRQAQRRAAGHDRGDRPQAGQRPGRADRPVRARGRHRSAELAHEVPRHHQPDRGDLSAGCSPTSAPRCARTASSTSC